MSGAAVTEKINLHLILAPQTKPTVWGSHTQTDRKKQGSVMGGNQHLVDDTRTLVVNSMRGLARSNPHLILDHSHRILYQKPTENRVHILSGGGSGHEPASSGFVGSNMLDCAVAGDIFASPSATAVAAGIRLLRPYPVLVLCLNYTGDRLHFGMAIEKCKALGQDMDLVVIADDVSVGRKFGGRVGRRGLAGAVLVDKIAGGCCRAGRDLAEVKAQAVEIVQNLVTVGASLTHASVPGASAEPDKSDEDTIEIGMGIHNEPGFKKIRTPKVSNLVQTLLKQLLDQDDVDRSFVPVKPRDEVVLLINNLGAISTLEIYHLTQIVGEQIERDYSLKVLRTYTGTFMTSLDGAGASITILNLSNLKNAEEVLEWLDLPSDAPGWNSAVVAEAWTEDRTEVSTETEKRKKSTRELPIDSSYSKRLIEGACKALIAAEPEITKYDTIAGDGDAGQTLETASDSILSALATDQISMGNAIDLFADVASILEDKMGGTSGALYTIFLSSLSSSLATLGAKTLDAKAMAESVQLSLGRLREYTTATTGDKTMMDALIPFSDTFSDTLDFSKAVEAAQKGAEGTKGMKAGLGRATYVDSSSSETVPDAGAIGVFKLLSGILSSISPS